MNPRDLDAPVADAPPGVRSEPPVARILVVDDNDGVLQCFRKILAGGPQTAASDLCELETALFGTPSDAPMPETAFEVDLHTDGEQACHAAFKAQLEARPYAVAFVDMRMPGGWDGLQTIEELWRVDAALQVVICTAHSDHAWDHVLARLGRPDQLLILRKPFEPIEVLQLAHALSRKWHLQRQQEARLTELELKVEERVQELRRANRTLRMLSHCNEALVRATSEPELLQAVCRHVVRIGGYRLAWVGYAREDEGRSVEPVAHAGSDRDYVDGLHLTWGDDEQRRGVGGAAIREGRPMVARHIATAPAFKASRSDALARGFASCIALPLRSKDGALGTLSIYSEEPDAFDAGETKLLVELADDLGYGITSLRETEARRRVEQELERQANFDGLTGLANRFTLEARASQCLADARRHHRQAALLFIDLDRLKIVNDTLGHAMGDRVLVDVAQRLTGAVRESDIVARLAGDEFVVFLNDVHTVADAATVAAKLVALLAEPSRIEQHEIRAAASIGVSLFPDDGDDVPTLLRNADTAMYSAKSLGGNAFRFFAPDMNARMAERYALEADLRRALERGELSVHYQPQASLATGAISGAEALVRWQHPEKGAIPPGEFIALAEDTGLIHSLGDWVIASVCAQWRAWLDAGLDVPPVAVNLSARQFRREDLVATIERALAQNRLDPGLLELEITESAVMHDVEAAIATVRRLKALGVRIALDDFGTGYSSLSYLKRFPIERLKIDQSFVRDVTTDPDDAAICNAIIGLAHNLKLAVIAEGVETEAQMNHLRRRHCDEMQGYLFSRPLPRDEFERLLAGDARLPLPEAEARQRTLLIVDDEAGIVSAIQRMLRRDGYRIMTAYSADEGLQRLTEGEVDVILSDQRMPGMTGVEFLRRAKELYPDTVRMVLSGYTELQSITDAVNEGAIYKFLTKPWVDEQLRAHIAEAFRRKEMADENRRLTQELQRKNEELLAAQRERGDSGGTR
jgi:diguanylate cyclase (GGDEF)-like protein